MLKMNLMDECENNLKKFRHQIPLKFDSMHGFRRLHFQFLKTLTDENIDMIEDFLNDRINGHCLETDCLTKISISTELMNRSLSKIECLRPKRKYSSMLSSELFEASHINEELLVGNLAISGASSMRRTLDENFEKRKKLMNALRSQRALLSAKHLLDHGPVNDIVIPDEKFECIHCVQLLDKLIANVDSSIKHSECRMRSYDQRIATAKAAHEKIVGASDSIK